MERFKKKTLALVLASVVTVVGAFGAENYKNSVMSLDFGRDSSGAMGMTVLMKNDFSERLEMTQKDANTYVLILPEINSEMSQSPKLAENILNVDVATMPYTNSSKGYTKITVTTDSNILLKAKPALYIPATQNVSQISTSPANLINTGYDESYEEEFVEEEPSSETNTETKRVIKEDTPPPEAVSSTGNSIPIQDILYTLIGFILVATIVVFLFQKGHARLQEITGNQGSINLDDDEPSKTTKKKIKKIKGTINSLDKKFPKTNTAPVNKPFAPVEPPPIPTVTVEEELNIIDMDELFQETKQSQEISSEDEENSALEDFLSAYTFDDEFFENQENSEVVIQEEESLFDEELYEKFINNDSLKFSQSDIEKINALLATEITDDTIRNINKYAVSNPIKKVPTKSEKLEDIVTTYAIKQNILFTPDDINVLNKLLSVEIDSDFLTNLKTNPQKMQEMQEEFSRQKSQPHKTSEFITLNVKDMLPDLSEALKKQAGKKIESNYKPEVVYFREGYEVSTLTLNDELPDLAAAINQKEFYKTRPSDAIQFVESGYDVQTMSISGLPDLKDVIKNPDKYRDPEPEIVVVDEDALLQNISNVVFKPFYDGSQSFEVINDFAEENNNLELLNAPSISDVQKEFEDFSDLKIIDEEYFEDTEIVEEELQESEYFATLEKNSYSDSDLDSELANLFDEKESKISEESNVLEQIVDESEDVEEELSENFAEENILIKEEEIELPRLERKENLRNLKNRKKDAEDLLQLIQEAKEQEKEERQVEEKKEKPKEVSTSTKKLEHEFCTIDGIRYNLLDKTEFSESAGCYLAKSKDEYDILGYFDEKVFILKHYETLKSEKIQSRVSGKVDDNITRYIVKLGVNKFILNVSNENMEFVMDLC